MNQAYYVDRKQVPFSEFLFYLTPDVNPRKTISTSAKMSVTSLGYLHSKNGGERRIRTSEGIRQQIYSLPQLATLVSPQFPEPMEGFEPPTS